MRTSRHGWAPGTGDAADDGILPVPTDPYPDPNIGAAAGARGTAQAETSARGADDAGTSAGASAGIVHPVAPRSFVEDQLDGYTYGATTVYGSNILEAWRYSTGLDTTVALIDDGFDPATTALYGDFSTALSRSFAAGSSSTFNTFGFGFSHDVDEPAGGYHGTTTSGEIGDSGADGLPVGLAPNAEIIGVKVTFGDVSFDTFVDALRYASAVGEVINDSWAFEGYGVGEPTDPDFASWYRALNAAVRYGRGGLGDVVVFAGGNDRADANTDALQPITANPEVIAVAASDPDGLVASYSNPGPGLLVAAIADSVAVPLPGGDSYGFGYGTSYAAPAVSSIASLMLSVNPSLGWRDVQEILADSAYAPPPSAGSFVTNGATGWNGGGMQFSEDLGFGVIDANVAVNLARAWTEQSTSANQDSRTMTDSTSVTIAPGATVSPTLAVAADIRVQQVEVTLTDSHLLAADSKLVLISPDGTQSILLDDAGLVGGTDLTGGLDLTGSVIDDNAFWGETGTGTWTLKVENTGSTAAVLQDWSLTLLGDNAARVAAPLVYTPEFASLAEADPARTVVTPGTATTLDLIALPGASSINLNARTGTIDGVAVRLQPGLRNVNADGSTGRVALVGLQAGGSELTGGDGPTTITGYGHDTINGGLGGTTIITGAGDSSVTLSSLAASTTVDTIASGGGDTIWAGSGTVSITDTGSGAGAYAAHYRGPFSGSGAGSTGDTIFGQSATLTFINGSGASVLYGGTGTVLVQAGVGGGVYHAGSGVGSALTAGTGKVVFYGGGSGDMLTAAGAANDTLIAGAGNEMLLGGTATGILTMQGGSGSDIMKAGAGRTDFTVGTGNDIITDGGLGDVITIAKGHAGGLDTIDNFRVGIDAIDLAGYSRSTAGNTIGSQTADGHGGTLLSLPDGTRIDLLGIAHASSNVFAGGEGFV